MDGGRSPEEANQHVALEIETPWLESVKRKAGMFLNRKPPDKPTIFRVPPGMRRSNPDAYEPKLVSIGPYHRGKSEDLKAMEELKWRLLYRYLSKVPNGSKNEGLTKMKDLEKQARDCYSEVIDLDSDQFVEMLLLDGCFLVQIIIALAIDDEILQEELRSPDNEILQEELILQLEAVPPEWYYFETPRRRARYSNNIGRSPVPNVPPGPEFLVAEELKSLLTDNMWFTNLIFQDLLLLENQLPYFIIEHLVDELRMPSWNSSRLQKEATFLFINFLPLPLYLKNQVPGRLPAQRFQDVHHLLHLFHKWILSIPKLGNASGNCLSKVLPWHRRNSPLSERPPSTVPTTTELTEAGVKITVREALSFLDISFCNGVLEIPVLQIADSTNLFFSNLTALEQCCPEKGMAITDYIQFLDNIINTPGDVELLHRKGIIHRYLGADEDIASLFNKLGNGVNVDPPRSYLKDVREDLNAYCQSRWPRWRAKAVHDYFNNPWAIISLIAAVLLIGFAFLQSAYAVLDYHKK